MRNSFHKLCAFKYNLYHYMKAELEHVRWVHVARLPLTVTAADVRRALSGVAADKVCPIAGVSAASGGGKVEWIPDKDTGFFYGGGLYSYPFSHLVPGLNLHTLSTPKSTLNRHSKEYVKHSAWSV
jgi:hypothetical protein